MRYVLGINSAYHESAACLLRDGVPVAFAEEERFNRRKHGKLARVDNPDELPRQAIQFCLRQAGINLGGVESIGYSFDPPLHLRNAGLGEPVGSIDWGSRDGEELFQARLRAIPDSLAGMASAQVSDRFHWIEHHLCHAASAFLVSPFDEAAVMAVDGIGEFATAWLGHGQGVRLRKLGEAEYPHSLGFLWEKLAKFLGFSEYDACKVMGLAAYGSPTAFAPALAKLISSNGEGELRLDADTLRFRGGDFGPLESLLGPRRQPGEPVDGRHADIAAALQKATDKAMLELAASLRRRTGSSRLCLAGGVALNCVSNRVLRESGLFQELYVQPAAHDAGTALGAAAWLWCRDLGGSRAFVLEHPYLGPGYSEAEMIAALEASGVRHRRSRNAAAEAAALIADGAVVGWFQGRMEAGPRALGNRSLLADPRRPEMGAAINEKVKHRESFQPFAPAVLAESAADWFRIAGRSWASDFMLLACEARPERAARIPAVVHADGTSRVQTVRAETNPLFHRLITEFGRKTGVPLVLNTSFNDSEPIVCSPKDALETFRNTRIDALLMGDFVVEREGVS
ncbi:MAG: carbamoyltransferase [Limisphaerales bacterium]